MIENKLTKHEFAALLKPILKLEGVQPILREFGNVFQEKLQSFDDIIEYSRRYNLTYNGIQIFISGAAEISKDSVYISLNCRIERKWFHFFMNPTIDFLNDLQAVCIEVFDGLTFSRMETTEYTNSYRRSTLENFVYIYDSSAFNSKRKAGNEISPLIIAPSKNKKYFFVEFLFNPNCYVRQDGKTILKENWKEHIPDIGNYLEQRADEIIKSWSK